MKFYKIKKLIAGYRLSFPGKTLIAFPDKYLNKGDVCVGINGQHMVIKNRQKALTFRVFKDKFGRKKDYTLSYFEWDPKKKSKIEVGCGRGIRARKEFGGLDI
jgi:hypothetical protein